MKEYWRTHPHPTKGKHLNLSEEAMETRIKVCKERFWSDEMRAKIGEKSKSRPHPEVAKPVLQYSLEGHFIREWPSIAEAERVYSVSIFDAMNGRSVKCRGYQWRYKTEDYPLEIEPVPLTRRNAKAILQYDKEGRFVKEYANIQELLKSMDIPRGTIYGVLRGHQKSTHNMQFRYKESDDFPLEIAPLRRAPGHWSKSDKCSEIAQKIWETRRINANID